MQKPRFVTKPEFVKWILVFLMISEFLGQSPKPRLQLFQLLAFLLTQTLAGLAGGRSEQAFPLPPT